MTTEERRQHTRIDIQMPLRMWLEEEYHGRPVVFEGYAQTSDLGIGGLFIRSDYLLPLGFPVNLEVGIGKEEALYVRGEIVHSISGGETREPGMGLMFTYVDTENRERLLRFFITDEISRFYDERFLVEFPHLESEISLEDAALVVNLWEDKGEILKSLHQPQNDRMQKSRREAEVKATKSRIRR